MVHADGQISEAELAAFADGSLPPRRRARIAACIERSPQLHVLVGAQWAALAAWNGSIDIARIHTGLTPPPLHRLAA